MNSSCKFHDTDLYGTLFFVIRTSKVITDLQDAGCEKSQRKNFDRLGDPAHFSSEK